MGLHAELIECARSTRDRGMGDAAEAQPARDREIRFVLNALPMAFISYPPQYRSHLLSSPVSIPSPILPSIDPGEEDPNE